jgi:hypothetical protein
MDPMLKRLVEAKMREGVALPLVMLKVADMTVIGHIASDEKFVQNARDYFVSRGEPTVVDEMGLSDVAGEPEYVTIVDASIMSPPLQSMDVPAMRVALGHVSAWFFNIVEEPPEGEAQ